MRIGGNTVNLDAKGRLTLPTKVRGVLDELCGGRLVLTAHRDGCLLLYPLPEFEEVERKLMRLPNQNREARQLQRMTLGLATELEMDASGRILIPPQLRQYAQLEKRVVLAWLANKYEIWNEDRWAKQQQEWMASAESGDQEQPEDLRRLSL